MAILTFEDALLAVAHQEIKNGTKRSVAAVYALMLPLMLSYQRERGDSLLLPDKYVAIHEAIRKRWPGKDDGMAALSSVKKTGWSIYEAVAQASAPDDQPQDTEATR